MAGRIASITFIWVCTVVAWAILGGTVQYRTQTGDEELKRAVGQLWGTVQRQRAPSVTYETKEKIVVKETSAGKITERIECRRTPHSVSLDSSDIQVGLDLDYRMKGLLWYSTYKVGFTGKFEFTNSTKERRRFIFELPLPSHGAVYDEFSLLVDGEKIRDLQVKDGSLRHDLPVEPGESPRFTVSYRSQGMDEWWYDFGTDVAQVRNFSLLMQTDFLKIDFPLNSISPTQKEETQGGWRLTWKYADLLSGVQIGMAMPRKLNPGPWVSKVTFFAPVSLFLFFFLLFMFTTLRNLKIHSMNYFFMGAAFFSYHLLLAYLVDHVAIHLSFWICSAVSIFLVVSYMRLVLGTKFALVEVGLSQFVFLVLFSYTFFFEGYTGLAVTIMCIVTLFIVMQMTARVDWESIFRGDRQCPPGRSVAGSLPAGQGTGSED
jgi:hypothetical protein